MNKYQNLVTQHNTISKNIISSLKLEINESNIKSKYINCNALPVNVFDYDELVVVNDELTFLDEYGNHYSLYAKCINNDLIEILYNIADLKIN